MANENPRRLFLRNAGLFFGGIIVAVPLRGIAQQMGSGPTGSGWVPPQPQSPQTSAPESGMAQVPNRNGSYTNVPTTQMNTSGSMSNAPPASANPAGTMTNIPSSLNNPTNTTNTNP